MWIIIFSLNIKNKFIKKRVKQQKARFFLLNFKITRILLESDRIR